MSNRTEDVERMRRRRRRQRWLLRLRLYFRRLVEPLPDEPSGPNPSNPRDSRMRQPPPEGL